MNLHSKQIKDIESYFPITDELYNKYIKDTELLKDFNERFSSEIRKINFKYKIINIKNKKNTINFINKIYKKQEYPYKYNFYIDNDKLIVIRCIIGSNYTIKKINEGLISSIPREGMLDILKRYFIFKNYPQLVKPKKLSNDIYINIKGNDSIFLENFIKKFDNFESFINNCGWFISNYHIKFESLIWDHYKYNKNNFLDSIRLIHDGDSILLTLESKYNIKITDDLPKILYHITNEKYINKIKKIGLVPKSTNTMASYPDRIYFTSNLERAKKLANELLDDIKYILPVMTNKIYNIDFYLDSKSIQFGGIYCVNNIPIRAIDFDTMEIIK